MRISVNGSILINHIDGKHGEVDYVSKVSKSLIPRVFAYINLNKDRYSTRSVGVQFFGEYDNDNFTPKQFISLLNTMLKELNAPVASMIVEVLVDYSVQQDAHLKQYIFSLNVTDGNIQHIKTNTL